MQAEMVKMQAKMVKHELNLGEMRAIMWKSEPKLSKHKLKYQSAEVQIEIPSPNRLKVKMWVEQSKTRVEWSKCKLNSQNKIWSPNILFLPFASSTT